MRKVRSGRNVRTGDGPPDTGSSRVDGDAATPITRGEAPTNAAGAPPAGQRAEAATGPRWLSPDVDRKRSDKPRADYQELWLAADTGWGSLALVATVPGISEQDAGAYLAATGIAAGPKPVALLDATGVRLAQADSIVRQVHALVAKGTRVIIVLESLGDNSAGIPIVRAVDAAVLVVRPGLTELGSIERTVELAGHDHILGMVTRPARSSRREDRQRRRRSSEGER